MYERGEDDQFGEGVHMTFKDWVIENDSGITIKTGSTDDDINQRVNDIVNKTGSVFFLVS